MNARRAAFQFCLLLLLATAPLAAQSATPTSVPSTPTPALAPGVLREIYLALGFGDAVFGLDEWLASAGEYDDRTTATWISTTYGALGHAEYLHFDGGYDPQHLALFFNDDWFSVSFKDYDNWQPGANCASNGMALHEFHLEKDGQQYAMRYWIQPVTPTRILTMHLVFPAARADLLDEYSHNFAPLLWTCGE